MSEHTPEPWRVDRLNINNEVVIRADDDVAYICMVFGRNKEADANLMAAAPAMLAALQALDAVLDFETPSSGFQMIEDGERLGAAMKQAATAIALSAAHRDGKEP